jgi:hypothetical protein
MNRLRGVAAERDKEAVETDQPAAPPQITEKRAARSA